MTVLWPNGSTTIPRVTSEFGMRTHPVTGAPSTMHYGIDLIGWSTIIAPASGVVSFAGYNGGAGNEVRIRADNGDVYRLLHNRELWVVTGQRVAQGQGVAVMGTTGSSTGVHCHYETHPGGGAAINPRDYMARANGGVDDMTPEEHNWLMNLYNAMFYGGPSMPDGQKALAVTVADIASGRRPFVSRTVDGKTVQIAWIQELADCKTIGIRTEGKIDQLAIGFTDDQVKAVGDQVSAALIEAGVGGASADDVRGIVENAFASLVLVQRDEAPA